MRDNGREELIVDQQCEKCQRDEELQHYEFAYKSTRDQIDALEVEVEVEVEVEALLVRSCHCAPDSTF